MSQKKKYTIAVLEKVHETNDACTIKFKQPGLKKISYKPGQFITLITQIKGRVYQRPYSVSSVYGLDSTINITIKAIQDGVVSTYLLNELEPGQSIEIIEPLGSFTLPDQLPETVVLWAAGSGISPLYSILRHLLFNTGIRIILNYSSRTSEQTILFEPIALLQQQFPERFIFNLFLSKEKPVEGKAYKTYTRLNQQQLNDLITGNAVKEDSLHYICGSNEYNIFVNDCLIQQGFQTERIKVEDYNQVVNEEDLQGISDAYVTISVKEMKSSVLVKRGQSILNAALDAGLNIDFSCQTGTCDMCMGQILKGQIRMIAHHKKEIKSEGDACLLCCSLPLTNDILISIN